MAQQRVGRLEIGISHRKFKFFDLNVTIGYESASGSPPIPSLRAKNCNLHSNSTVPMSMLVPPGHGHDRVTVQIAVFDSYQRGWSISACRYIADCNVLIEELELSASQASINLIQLTVVPYMEVCSTWCLARDKFYQAPSLFSCNVERLGSLGTRLPSYLKTFLMHTLS